VELQQAPPASAYAPPAPPANSPASEIVNQDIFVQLPTGKIVVEQVWSFSDTIHCGPDLTCSEVLKSMSSDHPRLVDPPPMDRREMFARLIRTDGPLAAAGPWCEEYVLVLMARLHPTDSRLDQPARFGMWLDPDGQDRVYKWSHEMVAACSELSILLRDNPDMIVESVMPGDTLHFRLMPDDCATGPAPLLKIECSLSTVLAEAARFKSPMGSNSGFGQAAAQLLDPTCKSNLNSQGIRLSTSDEKCKAGFYGWVLMYLVKSLIVTSRILEILGGQVICFFPVLVLCLVHGFCPVHPHPDSMRWIFAWTPWAGFTLGPERMIPAAPQTRVTIASGTRWLSELVEEGKAANRDEKAKAKANAKAKAQAEKAKAKAEKAKVDAALSRIQQAKRDLKQRQEAKRRQDKGMVPGTCDKCGKSYMDLTVSHRCIPARVQRSNTSVSA